MNIGDKFSYVTVIGTAERKQKGKSFVRVQCVCGKIWDARADSLKAGEITSCSCQRRSALTHGMSYSREYQTWASMIQRCTNANAKVYRFYGGRGISVCEPWLQFENFLADMGPRPAGMSIERKDNNDGYHPGNCVWATKSEQMRNVRGAKLVTLCGEQLALNQARNALGLGSGTVNNRMRQYGDTPQQAINWYFAEHMLAEIAA